MARYIDLQNELLEIGGQDANSEFHDMVKAEIQRQYRSLLVDINQDSQRREFSLTTVADTSKYGFSLYVKEIQNIEDPDNNRFIYDISAREFDTRFPGSTDTGTPIRAYPFGVFGVQKQPASTGTITVESSSAADTGTNYQVRVSGYVSDVLTAETITVTGTTAVTSTNSYSAIERDVKVLATGYTFAGNVTVKDSSGNTLSVIPTWWDSPDYLWYEFQPIPSSAITYTVRAIMRKPDLVDDDDWPDIDQDFHELLIYGPAAVLLPGIGMEPAAQTHSKWFQHRYEKFMDSQKRRPSRVRSFNNVHTNNVLRPPHKPLIKNVNI